MKPGAPQSGTSGGALYMILWEFHVKPGREERFEQVYSPEGDWARFFRQGKGYLGTELDRDLQRKGRYLTADYWTSQTAYESFREQRLGEYRALDKRCAELTGRETALGKFLCRGTAQRLARARTASFSVVGGMQ
jgi:heme-degrading monooxygenase HmoA